MSRAERIGPWAALSSALIAGISNGFYAVAAWSFGPLWFLVYGGILGGLLTGSIFKFSGGTFRNLSRHHLWWSAARLVLSRGFLGAVLLAWGIQHTTASKMVVLTKMEPYLVLGWGWIIAREKVNRDELWLLTLHIIGAILVSSSGSLTHLLSDGFGDLLVFLGVAATAFSYRDARAVSQAVGPWGAMFLSDIGGMLLILPIALFTPHPEVLSSNGFLNLFISVGLFRTFAQPLWLLALNNLAPWKVSALRAISPLTGIPFAWYYLGETLDTPQIYGAVIVLLTSALIGKLHKR
jgi:drug/metabolite transporter (DMT)-like permease